MVFESHISFKEKGVFASSLNRRLKFHNKSKINSVIYLYFLSY